MLSTPHEDRSAEVQKVAHMGRFAERTDRIATLNVLLVETDKGKVLTALQEQGYRFGEGFDKKELPEIQDAMREVIAQMEAMNAEVPGLATAIQKNIVDVARSAETTSRQLSAENEKFLGSLQFKTDYEQCAALLKREKREPAWPSFEQAMEIVRSFGDKVLDELRQRCKEKKLVIAKKETPNDFGIRAKAGKMYCSDVNDSIFFGGTLGNANGFSIGIVEGVKEPNFLPSQTNPDNNLGEHYDETYAELTASGLRSPQGHEYVALFEVMKANGIIIDQNGYTLLDIGERKNKRSPVPLADVYSSGPNLNRFNPDSQYDCLHVRPSAWGDYVQS